MSDSQLIGTGPDFSRDPVHEENGQWYFWNETSSDRHGPFACESVARHHLAAYCQFLATSAAPCTITAYMDSSPHPR